MNEKMDSEWIVLVLETSDYGATSYNRVCVSMCVMLLMVCGESERISRRRCGNPLQPIWKEKQ